MKNSFYAGLLILGFSTGVTVLQAAEPVEAKRMSAADRYIAQFRDRLELSDEQTQRIKPVLVANAGAMMAVIRRQNEFENGESDNEDGPDARKSLKLADEVDMIRAETMGKLAVILTPEQLAEYKSMQDVGSKKARTLIQSK